MTGSAPPALARRPGALAGLIVIGAHLSALWLLRSAQGADSPPALAVQRVTLRLIPPLIAPPAPARPAEPSAPATLRVPPHPPRSRPDRAPISAPAPETPVAQPITRSEPAASAPDAPPSLLDNEATRRAIRASARAPSLSEQLAHSRDEPHRPGTQEQLGAAVEAAGKGDCLKGEYAGAGMGLLSLPFLALAEARGDCAR